MVKKLMNTIMLTCRKATELVSLKNYRQLTLVEKMQLKLHMMGCHACQKFNIQNELIDQAVEKLKSEDIGFQTLPKERKEFIEKHIHPHS